MEAFAKSMGGAANKMEQEGQQEVQLPFLNRLRSEVSDSAEFRSLASRLYSGVRDALRKDDLPSFGTLTRGEQEALVNRVRSQLLEDEVYKKCRDATWRALDAALDAEAESLLSKRAGGIGGRPGPGPSWPPTHGHAGHDDVDEEEEERRKKEPSGKVGAILELASEGASQLLDRWPAAQDELLWLLNTELPTPLRRAVWGLKLRAPAARSIYETKRAESVFATLSLRDGAIHQGCQATLQRIAPAQLKQIPFLKTCLSYADSLRPLPPPPSGWPSAQIDTPAGEGGGAAAGEAAPVEKAAGGGGGSSGGAIHTAPLESFWGVPLLRVFVPPASGRSLSSTEQAELEGTLIEHFLALLSQPKPLLGLAAAKAEKGTKVAQPPLAEFLLGEADPDLSTKLVGVLGVTGVDAMLLPYVQRLAVGFFSADVTAFVWDLCLLAGWAQLQPVFTASLICMRESLLSAADANAIKAYIATAAPSLTLDQMQRELNQKFMPDIRKQVGAPQVQEAFELTPGGYF